MFPSPKKSFENVISMVNFINAREKKIIEDMDIIRLQDRRIAR